MEKITKLNIDDNNEGEVIHINEDVELKITRRGNTYYVDAYKQFTGTDEEAVNHDYDSDFIDTLTIEI